MLFAQLCDGMWRFVVMHPLENSSNRYHVVTNDVRIIRFHKLPRLYGEIDFEHIDAGDNRIVGFMEVRPENLVEKDRATVANFTMLKLLLTYGKRLESYRRDHSFADYLEDNIILRGASHRQKVLPLIAYTYAGRFVLFYMEDGRLKTTPIEETCFIKNCVITPMTEVQDKAVAAMERSLEGLRQHIVELNKRSIDTDRIVANSSVLSYIRDR